jgi:hypothetical protein
VPTWLTPTIAITFVGAVISFLVFRRDRPRVELTVSFNMANIAEQWTTIVTARNLGRRAAHVSHVGLMRARWWRLGRERKKVVSPWSAKGETLQEGGKPWHVPFRQEGEAWEHLTRRPGYVRAFAIVAGRPVYSKVVRVPDDLQKFKSALTDVLGSYEVKGPPAGP